MATNHTASIEIKDGVNSQAFFAFAPPRTLLLFVHGFGGNALSTWNNFSSMILMDNMCAHADVVFYGYDTLKGQAGDHAAQLYSFLKKAIKPLASGVLPAAQQLPERQYDKIVLAGHSLGSILIRQALLLANIDGQPWLNKTGMALFAPAHNGANLIPLVKEALPGLWGLIGVFARYRYKILDDLNPETSKIIGYIRDESKELIDQGKGDFMKAKLVVFAKGDKVVSNIQYLQDRPAEVIEGYSHVKVCKPTDKYQQPLQLLKQLL